MSIRITLLLLLVAYFSYYSWRNWFVGLCGAVVMMAVIEHPDFPKGLLGVQGLNPWNILFLNVFLAWRAQRTRNEFDWDLPPIYSRLLLLFGAVILVGFIRMVMDPSYLEDFSFASELSERLINNAKWLMVCVLFFDACRTRRRVETALVCLLSIYLLLAVQVIRWVPLSAAVSGDDSFTRLTYKMCQNEIGYNRVTLSMMLSGAAWAIFASLPLCKSRRTQFLVLSASGCAFLGMALTGGRTGYVAWAFVGLILCLVRWRKILPFLPIGAAAILIALPSVRERLFSGFGSTEGSVVTRTDDYEVTSGRTLIWPYVIEKIGEGPIIGYGRLGMNRTGLADSLMSELNESFPHPHNAYLEVLLDNGIIGFMVVIPFFLFMLAKSGQLFVDRSDPLFGALGGVGCALILALLAGSMGGQTFYPREGSVGMWVAFGLVMRVSVERKRSRESGYPLFEEDEMDEELADEEHIDERELQSA